LTIKLGHRLRITFVLSLLRSSLVSVANAVAAQSAREGQYLKHLVVPAFGKPDAAADLVRREMGGRFLTVTPVDEGQQGCIRLLTDRGRVLSAWTNRHGRLRSAR